VHKPLFLFFEGDLGLKAARRKPGRIGHERAQRSQEKQKISLLYAFFAFLCGKGLILARMREFHAIAGQHFYFLDAVLGGIARY
jgi:hypothetical protein